MKTKSVPPFWLLALLGVTVLTSIATNFYAFATYPCWFDEAVISDIAFHNANEGIWKLDVIPTSEGARAYGPVYFYIQEFLIKWFGFDAVTMRAGNALAAYLVALCVGGMVWSGCRYGWRSCLT